MALIDKKDRKILLELDKDARSSYKKIGKRIGLSKVAVMNRIKRMEKENIILEYITMIDTMRFGYSNYVVYLKFRKTTSEKEKEIIQKLIDHDKVWALCTAIVAVDVTVALSAKSPAEFYCEWDKIYKTIHEKVSVIRIAVLVEFVHYTRNYLVPESKTEKKETMIGKLGSIEIDEADNEILKILSKNGRAQIIEIAQKVKLTSSAVIYRIKNLEKKGIIQGYRANINFRKLGYEYFKVFLTLDNIASRHEILTWLKTQKSLVYFDGFIGGKDIEFDLEVEGVSSFLKFIEKLKGRFGEFILEINYFQALIFLKYSFYPEIWSTKNKGSGS